jgi:hypothetical protein
MVMVTTMTMNMEQLAIESFKTGLKEPYHRHPPKSCLLVFLIKILT